MELLHGDCRALLAALPAASVDAIVTDPPYELGFMGKSWDRSGVAFQPETWAAALHVLKPGGHLVAFGGTRTWHRLACAIEDAGFELRDTLCWLYGQGFPKSLDVGKALDKAAGAERAVIGQHERANLRKGGAGFRNLDGLADETRGPIALTAPATDLARQWDGWGTALKPAVEFIVWAQKPHDLIGLSGILTQKIWSAVCQLPSYARDAESPSLSSLNGFVGDVDSALWRAVEQSSTPDALYDLMATWRSGSEIPSSLSIVWSWLDTLGALLAPTTTFTTEMASSLTTDLKTLNSLLSQPTPATIIEALTPIAGTALSASPVAALFSAVRVKLLSILKPSALGSVTADAASPLAPNLSLIILARAPLSDKTVAANVARWGTGALNVDGCRIGTDSTHRPLGKKMNGQYGAHALSEQGPVGRIGGSDAGRWPANVCLSHTLFCTPAGTRQVRGSHDTTGVWGHRRTVQVYGRHNCERGADQREPGYTAPDGTETVEAWECAPDCPVALLDAQSGERPAGHHPAHRNGTGMWAGEGGGFNGNSGEERYLDRGGASRFFYCSKASARERSAGLPNGERNPHPTVKPVALCRWLIRLVCPPGGVVCDPFMGSGSIGVAAREEGVEYIGIEQHAPYLETARQRIGVPA